MKPKLFLIAVTACMIVACNSPIKNGDSVHLSIKNTTNVSFNKNNSLSCTTGNKTPFIISIDKNNKIQLSTEFGDNLYLENYYVNISKNNGFWIYCFERNLGGGIPRMKFFHPFINSNNVFFYFDLFLKELT